MTETQAYARLPAVRRVGQSNWPGRRGRSQSQRVEDPALSELLASNSAKSGGRARNAPHDAEEYLTELFQPVAHGAVYAALCYSQIDLLFAMPLAGARATTVKAVVDPEPR